MCLISSAVLCLVVQSCLTFCDPWTIACQAPLFMGFSRQEYWSGLPCSPSGDLPNPGIQHRSSALQVNSLPAEPPRKSKKPYSFLLLLLLSRFSHVRLCATP